MNNNIILSSITREVLATTRVLYAYSCNDQRARSAKNASTSARSTMY